MRKTLAALILFALAGSCGFPHDPDTELYRCTTDGDCGAGDVCVQRKDTGDGICFPVGQCVAETCDAKDDDCDGVIDDVPDAGQSCTSALPGACAPGSLLCLGDGGFGCVSSVMPQPEACDGAASDLDCDGLADCADADCEGQHACGEGCICRDEAAHETACDDGLDDDGDALVDCDDPDCLGELCAPGANCGTAGPLVLADGGLPDAGAVDAGDADAGDATGETDLDGGPADVDAGDLDAGQEDHDAGALDGGPAGLDAGLPVYCAAVEQACDDGLDEDGDGRADCLDADCLGLACSDGGLCLPDGGCGQP